MKNERKRQLKGSVLFTVVSVMSLLIIFLMATLVLATSADKRAHKSYSSSQTQYTARTAVDSVFHAIGASQDFADAIDSLSSSNQGPLNVTVDIANAASMGRVDNCTVTWVGSQKFYNEDKGEWEVKDLLRITANVTLGGQTSTGSSYILKDPPQNQNQNGGGAGFVTAGGAETSNHTSAFGGTYFNIREHVDSAGTIAYDTLNYDLINKNYLTNEDFELTNGQVIEADFVVNGNVKLTQAGIFAYPAPGTGVAIWGDLMLGSGGGADLKLTAYNLDSYMDLKYTEVPYLYVDGTLANYDLATGQGGTSMTLGNGTFPLNIFCGNFDFAGGEVEFYSDIYCMDENATSTLSGTAETELFRWYSSVINKTVSENAAAHYYGNIYSKGDLEFKGQKEHVINGDLRIEGDLTISEGASLTVYGDVVVGGTLTVNTNKAVKLCENMTKSLYCDNIVNNNPTNFRVNKTLFGVSELKPDFVQIDNIYHEETYTVKPEYKETKHIPNFYEYEVYGNTGLFGEYPIWVGDGTKIYYKYTAYNELAPDDTATMDGSKYYNAWEIGQYAPGGFIYKEVDANWVETGNGTDVEAYYYEMATGQKVEKDVAVTVNPAYYTMANYDGTNITDSTVPTTELLSYFDCTTAPPTRVTEAQAKVISSNQAIASYKDPERSTPSKVVTNIYPLEMEKKVILGLNTGPSDPVIYGYNGGNYQALTKDDTQIIKTVKELVQNNSINPYDNALYSITSSTYATDATNNVYINDDLGGNKDHPENLTTGAYETDPIKKSCTLSGDITIENDIYFKTENGEEIWVVIDGNITLANGADFIYLDEGNAVTSKLNFLFKNGSSLKLSAGGKIISKKMWDIITDPSKVGSITNYATLNVPANATELEPAQIYIYTEENTAGTNTIATLYLDNTGCLVTGNIKAPYLDFQNYSAGYKLPNNFYYNGANIVGYNFDLATLRAGSTQNYGLMDNDGDLKYDDYNLASPNHKFTADGMDVTMERIAVIGCLNVGSASTLQNDWCVLYIDPNKGLNNNTTTPDQTHWYQTIYYEEY